MESGEKSQHWSGLSRSHLLILAAVLAASHLMTDKSHMEAEIAAEIRRLNVTPNAHQGFLFFNRVPKVGSETIKSLLKSLQGRNNFTHIVDNAEVKRRAGEKTFISREEQKGYAQMFVEHFKPKSSYSKHISFIDFREMGYDFQPIYVNFVREPVQRIISWYYYIRQPTYMFSTGIRQTATGGGKNESYFKSVKKGQSSSFVRPVFYKTTFEECVLDPNNGECKWIPGRNHIYNGEGGSHASQIMFFCGHKPHCAVINDQRAFRDAVRNVDRHFSVVGVLEEMETSLSVLESFVPAFFAGVGDIYKSRRAAAKKINSNQYRRPVSEEIRALVRSNMTTEIDFYNFCRQRLRKQKLALGL